MLKNALCEKTLNKKNLERKNELDFFIFIMYNGFIEVTGESHVTFFIVQFLAFK